uniref:Transmembrane protein n=1 Tax=Panagrellus redivivus TaxID=6233 RepID=A0A7E4UWV1_PANRE
MTAYLPEPDQFVHVFIGTLAVASAVRSKYQRASGVFFHAFSGAILLLYPSLLHKPLVTGEFDDLHTHLQRFAGAFHIGFAYFAFRSLHDTLRVEPIVHFAKALTAGFLFAVQLLTAFNLSESSTRGIRFNQHYLLPVLLTDGIWLLVETYKLVRNPRVLNDEIDLMCQRTTRFIEGRSNLDIEKVLLVDSALSFVYAFSNFAFPNQILKLIIKHTYLLDGAHKFYSRQFGCFMLFSAIVSLLGSHFTVAHQKNYVLQRILTQVLIVAVHLYGHFGLNIYDLSHCTPFVISILYISLLMTMFFKIQREEDADNAKGVSSKDPKTTVITFKKTT